jgi:zinc-ribbon domain
MPFCSNCGQQLTIGTEKFCPNCGQDLKKGGGAEATTNHNVRDSINIQGAGGDVFGIGVRGSGHVIGKNVVVGSGTISINEQQLQKLPDKYAESLKTFSETLNNHLKGQQVPEDKVKEVNETLNDFAKEVEDVKPGEEKNLNARKNRIINGKFGNIVQGVFKVLPTVARIASSLFAPLSPFSNPSIVDGITATPNDGTYTATLSGHPTPDQLDAFRNDCDSIPNSVLVIFRLDGATCTFPSTPPT